MSDETKTLTEAEQAAKDRADNFGFYHREGRPTGEQVALTPEQLAARKKRNVYIALSLVAFMVAVFLITVVRLSQNVAAGAAG
ncbi:protoheme IX farnesyltransferase [Maricaulis parjimensis]|uniref:protoheme IX farnesyltransferase n=1 Tax=Maricaulis parjimensis TaxID=144023 RepID=UPI001EEE08EE|nr:protoheme IX farnesyltransferase [Maricaulis parjimensis]